MSKILIVDDEEMTLEWIAAELANKLCDVELSLANNGMEALHRLDEFRPDIVVTDHDMPYLNGTEILNEIAKRGYRTPVILITGDGAKIESDLFSHVIEKPFEISALVDIVRKYLPN